MQPTVSPWAWVASWDRREHARAHDRAHDRAATRTRVPDKYPFYRLREDSRLRLDTLAKTLLLNRQWPPTSAPVTWRVDRFHDTEPWAVPDIKSIQRYRPYEPVSIVLPGSVPGASGAAGGVGGGAAGGAGGAGGGGGAAQGWGHAARGWAAGAVVLALLVLIVRAAENCLHKKLFKAIYMHTNVGAGELQQDILRGHYRLQGVRRQESDEWCTPNVTATSLQHHNFDGDWIGPELPRLDDSERYPAPRRAPDLPPPYAECARGLPPAILKYLTQESPPPYSACYLPYSSGPKDIEPQVHLEIRRRQNIQDERAHSSTEIDNVQNDLIENGLRTDSAAIMSSSHDTDNLDPGIQTELVFDNGRVVERPSLDLDSDNNETGVASNDNVVETRHADVRVVYIDETVTVITTDRALPV